jgi:hypothetical protein
VELSLFVIRAVVMRGVVVRGVFSMRAARCAVDREAGEEPRSGLTAV